MPVKEVDKNLQIQSVIREDGIFWRDAQAPVFQLYGLFPPAVYGDGYVRMPPEAAAAVSENTETLCKHTAGGKLRFTTNSEYVAIRCGYAEQRHSPHMPISCSGSFDLYIRENGQYRFVKVFTAPFGADQGYEAIYHFENRQERDITLHFPPYNTVTWLEIGLEPDAPVFHSPAYRCKKPVVFYGSSITQGACASRPGNSYTNMLSQALDIEIWNLGFSGNAKGEAAMAEYISTLDMEALVMDYDHNAPTVSHLAETHRPFFEIIRKAQPELPILFISRPAMHVVDHVVQRREVILDTYRSAVAAGDSRVWFLDGSEFYGHDRRDLCSVDGIHPNDLGFFRMYEGILPALKTILGL